MGRLPAPMVFASRPNLRSGRGGGWGSRPLGSDFFFFSERSELCLTHMVGQRGWSGCIPCFVLFFFKPSDFPQVSIITDPRTQRPVREFRMAHSSLGGVHGSLFALDFLTLSCYYRSSTWTLWEGTKPGGRGLSASLHLLLTSSGRLQGPGTGRMHIARVWRVPMILPAPLHSLLVLSFRVLPTHQSELSCHNRVGCRRPWRSPVEVCGGASAQGLRGCLPCLGGCCGKKSSMIMQARNKPLLLCSVLFRFYFLFFLFLSFGQVP